MNPELEKIIQGVNLSYQKRKGEEDKIWIGFDEELQELTGIVSREFDRILKETDLSVIRNNIKRKVKINNFEVNYNIQLKKGFTIRIKEWDVDINGKPHSDRESNYLYCAHDYLEQVISFDNKLDPKITEFKKDFNVSHISYDCGCGSNHK